MSQGNCEEIEASHGQVAVGARPGQSNKAYWVKDVSAFAADVGFLCPILVTKAAWESCIVVPDDCPGQDRQQRLLNLLSAMDITCLDYEGGGEIPFELAVSDEEGQAREVQLRAACKRSPATGE
jgi:hypothetical protein